MTTQHHRTRAVDEWMCGAAGGIAKVVTGHPFDTVKGRVQSGVFPSSMSALRGTLRDEGALALYKGVLPPCISVGFVSALLLFANSRIRTFLQPDPTARLTYGQMAIAGGSAGAITAFVLSPLDVVKLWQQVERATPAATSASKQQPTLSRPRDILRVAKLAGPTQLRRGFTATLLREIGTFGIFFPTNEYLKTQLAVATSPRDTNASAAATTLPLSRRVLAAGTSGVLCWLPCYPIDQIKTAQQLFGHPSKAVDAASLRGEPTMVNCAAHIYREHGWRGFTRGLGPCLLRAFPTYTAQFTLYDYLISQK